MSKSIVKTTGKRYSWLFLLIFCFAACSSTPQWISSDSGDNSEQAGGLIPGSGEGGEIPPALAEATDNFNQPKQGGSERPVDIIFIVDTSGSLISERRLIADNVDSLLQPLKDQNLNDYRLTVFPAHSLSDYAGRPVAGEKRAQVLYERLFDGSYGDTDACRTEQHGVDPFAQLKCEFKANIAAADDSLRELEKDRAPRFTLPDNPFRLIDDSGVEQLYEDTHLDFDKYLPMGEFGLRSLEVGISDKLKSNQNLSGQVWKMLLMPDGPLGPNGKPTLVAHYLPVSVSDQRILRPEASWNFIFMSDENDICIKESFRAEDGNWYQQTVGNGQWYNTTWETDSPTNHWVEAYGNRDFCQSSIYPGSRITPQLLINGLQAVRGSEPFTMHAFGYFDLPGYNAPEDTPKTQESHSIGYWEAVDGVKGKLIDIKNTAQYGSALEDLGSQIAENTQLQNTFCLTNDPYQPTSVRCFVDGVEKSNDFQYNINACPQTTHHAAVYLPDAGSYQSLIVCQYQYAVE